MPSIPTATSRPDGRTLNLCPVGSARSVSRARASPSSAHVCRDGEKRSNGANLSVREDVLGSQWIVRDEQIPAEACSAIEGSVTPGLHRLVRFTVTTPNTGNADSDKGCNR